MIDGEIELLESILAIETSRAKRRDEGVADLPVLGSARFVSQCHRFFSTEVVWALHTEAPTLCCSLREGPRQWRDGAKDDAGDVFSQCWACW